MPSPCRALAEPVSGSGSGHPPSGAAPTVIEKPVP